MIRSRRAVAIETAIAALLFLSSTALALAALRTFRAAGAQPQFYQANFDPAVMMACGRGFVAPQTLPEPLRAFLYRERNEFSCADLPPDTPVAPVSWNGTWFYLYAAAAAVWRLAGISWTVLDRLVAVLAGITTVALYGLLRIAGGRWPAAAIAGLLTVSPGNLAYLLSLRDYSKAPFVLVAVFILALLIVRPMSRVTTIAVAALFGAVVGAGYGFRNDLLIMAPFGVAVVLLLLPGGWRAQLPRNLAAAVVLALAFLCAGWPALRALKTGSCQYHYGLLGLTEPMVTELGLTRASYSFGDHFLDTFVDLKVGDYAQRTAGITAPGLCSPSYDAASGSLFRQVAITFPADLAMHAYGAVLAIIYAAPVIPGITAGVLPFPDSATMRRVYDQLHAITSPLALLGPLVVLLAVYAAWLRSPRFGIALTVFILFLCGYTAIEFEARHWFHLRFIPWWSALFVIETLVHRPHPWPRVAFVRAAAGVGATLAALVCALAVLRLVQIRSVTALVKRYEAVPSSPLDVVRRADAADVAWPSLDYADPPAHRSSDLLIVTLDTVRCGSRRPVLVQARYDADAPSHDMTTTIAVDVPDAGGPTRVFVPVFSQGIGDRTLLRFTALQTDGYPGCLGEIRRVADRSAIPLWLQMQVPTPRLYQTLRRPRLLR